MVVVGCALLVVCFWCVLFTVRALLFVICSFGALCSLFVFSSCVMSCFVFCGTRLLCVVACVCLLCVDCCSVVC